MVLSRDNSYVPAANAGDSAGNLTPKSECSGEPESHVDTVRSEGVAQAPTLPPAAATSSETPHKATTPAGSDADATAVADAAMLARASDGDEHAEAVAAATTTAIRCLQRQGPAGPVPWTGWGLGAVVPVIPASPGAGASAVAAVLADALAALDWRVLVADTAEPGRSGLAYAARSDGPVTAGPERNVRLRFSWRGRVLLARCETALPILAPGMLPPPQYWRPPESIGPPQITIADLSYDAWRLAAHPLSGPGMWLRTGQPAPRPILVVRASRPSVRAAEGVLARLQVWTTPGVAVTPAALVVLGAQRWPPGVVGAVGRRVAMLLPRTVFLPWSSTMDTNGVTPESTPLALQKALCPLLRAWELTPAEARRRPRLFRGAAR